MATWSRRILAVLAWGLWALTLVFGLLGLAVGLVHSLAPAALGSLLVGEVALAGLGALVVTRRPAVRSGWLLISVSLTTAVGAAAWVIAWSETLGQTSYPLHLKLFLAAAEVVWSLAISSLLLLLLTAPDGRFLSRRWQLCVPVILAFIFFWSAWAALNAFTNEDLSSYLGNQGTLDSGGGVVETPLMELMGMGTIVTLGSLVVLAATALVMRYRRSRGEERQQLKWVVLGCGLALMFHVGEVTHLEAQPLRALQDTFAMAAYLSLTAGFGFALLKYRLWDIDVVVRRSLVYGTLWLAIAASYAGAALLLGLAVSARVPVWLAIGLTVFTTLAFQPARRRLERLADRWVFGQREPAIKAVQSFGLRLGNAQNIDDIASQLAQAARTTVPIEWVQVCIEDSPTIESGTARRPSDSVALVHGEEYLGRLAYRPLPGHELSEEEHATLAALCTQASTAISHAFLAARIVRAQELERRRIERNIHDGAQQELVALVAKVGLARNQNGAFDHGEFLAELQGEIRAILANLRELAQGVHPSVLVDGGLAAAIEDRCSRLSIPVSLRLAPAVRDRRLPSDIEAAAYFVVAEGLTNLLRHSGAGAATVEASVSGANLLLLVSDDGAGFDPASVSRLGGLQGLADRLQAIGGSLVVDSAPGQGTSLRARLPVPLAASA